MSKVLLVLSVWVLVPVLSVRAACCYFSAKNSDILQPAQKVFITWDPTQKLESFTVQPKFTGNALDFGMVIPTPTQPKLHEMPRDFFKHLALYSILKNREFPYSKLLPQPVYFGTPLSFSGGSFAGGFGGGGVVMTTPAPSPRRPPVIICESGVVGSLDYKIIEAERSDVLFTWLKDNKYHYTGDEATLNHYVEKKWLFTVMKIDTMQMKRNKDGTYAGEVTPTRFQFSSEEIVYPLKITQLSVKDKTEALFYIQAPTKVELQGDNSYQYQWVPMLRAASGCSGGLPGQGDQWLKSFEKQTPRLLERAEELGFNFMSGKRPEPNARGHTPTTMEWARKLRGDDLRILTGEAPYSERVPNVDDGIQLADVRDPRTAPIAFKIIQARLEYCQKMRPRGFLVREAPPGAVQKLRELKGHLQAGLFITKFRKIFARDEMNEDLVVVPASYKGVEDFSEYEEILPTSPP